MCLCRRFASLQAEICARCSEIPSRSFWDVALRKITLAWCRSHLDLWLQRSYQFILVQAKFLSKNSSSHIFKNGKLVWPWPSATKIESADWRNMVFAVLGGCMNVLQKPKTFLSTHVCACISFLSHRFERSCPRIAMSSKMQSSSSIAQARRTVQQLRIEASIERIKVWFFSWPLILSALLRHECVCTDFFAGVQGFIRPNALLWRTRQERPAAHGHRRFRESFQGQEALHCFVGGHLRYYCCFLFWLSRGKKINW